MKISIIDFDNTGFPNLALMKISARHKRRGDTVGFHEPLFSKPDKIYAASVFRFSKKNFLNLKEENCVIGGTGFGCNINLSEETEHIQPDYSLYGINYSMGFITRGCIRKCPFCIVPSKEGGIRFNAPVNEFQQHRNVVLLDNNILACEQGINELEEISKTDIRIDANQGLDFRLVTPHIANILAKLKWIKFIRTACDSDSNFEAVKRAVELLGSRGVKPYRIFCYALVKGEEDIPRIKELDKLGIIPFAMGYIDLDTGKKSHEVVRICNWVNKRSTFKAEPDFAKYSTRKLYEKSDNSLFNGGVAWNRFSS